MLDALDGTARHATPRVNLAVVARAPAERIRAFARGRGWRHLRLLYHRHVDMIWPLWNRLDFMPEGRGSDWFPALSYG